MAGVNVSCPICGFPTPAPSYNGQTRMCAHCGQTLEASVSQDSGGFTFARVLLAGIIGLGIGIIAGPSILAATEEGRRRLEEMTREALRR